MTVNPTGRLRPINVGNVVSIGIRLYRTNFKTYSGIGLKAMLWSLVPVYGWARSLMLLGQIGRLGFQEMIREPEPVPVALRKVEPRMWAFLGITLLITLIQMGVSMGLSLAGMFISIPFFFLAALGDVGAALSTLLQLILQLAIFGAQIWVQARFWLYDLFIAVETETEAVQSISRSWQLTQRSSFRVQMVLIIAYLIVLPLYLLSFTPFLLTVPYFVNFSPDNPDPTLFLVILLAMFMVIGLVLAVSVVAIPFFQSVKAVLYYDCRSRREGLDLALRDR
jgi:hypothetical protein